MAPHAVQLVQRSHRSQRLRAPLPRVLTEGQYIFTLLTKYFQILTQPVGARCPPGWPAGAGSAGCRRARAGAAWPIREEYWVTWPDAVFSVTRSHLAQGDEVRVCDEGGDVEQGQVGQRGEAHHLRGGGTLVLGQFY